MSCVDKLIVLELNEEEKFRELFDDSGLDRRKFHQKKNFQEIASFSLWLESWHLQLKCVLPPPQQKYNKSWKITKATGEFFCDGKVNITTSRINFIDRYVSKSRYLSMYPTRNPGIMLTMPMPKKGTLEFWIREGCREKNPEKSGLLPNQGGSPRVNKKPNLKFANVFI